MFKNILIIISILIMVNVKYVYETEKLIFTNNKDPMIWDLKNKSITSNFSLTFILKINSTSNYNHSFLSIGYHNLFWNDININEVGKENKITKMKDYTYYFRINNKKNSTPIYTNTYYEFFLNFEKQNINAPYYKLWTTFGFTQSYFLSSHKTGNIKIDLEKLLIIIGSKNPSQLSKFDFTIENLTIYNSILSYNQRNSVFIHGSKGLLFIDFSSSLSYSQYFYNKINSGFIGGINGNSIYSDPNDLFYDYNNSSGTVTKKLFLFKSKQYILLSQKIINFLDNNSIGSYTVYLKVTLHLNSNTTNVSLGKEYKLYNRNNVSGVKVVLKKVKENSTNNFEFTIEYIEDNYYVFNNIISNTDTLNIDYIFLTYFRLYNGKFNININYKIKNLVNSLSISQPSNLNLSSMDNHYIGDSSTASPNSTKDIIDSALILIEIEEIMIGKGINLEIINDNIVFDNIMLYCHALVNNKISRSNSLNDCTNSRGNTVTISNNCEYEESPNCIFRIPEFNDPITIASSTDINQYTLDLFQNLWNSSNVINSSISSILRTSVVGIVSTTTSADINSSIINIRYFLNQLINFQKPYKQKFSKIPKMITQTTFTFTTNYVINFDYSTLNFTVNHNVLVEIKFNNNSNNNSGDIFKIEFQNIFYYIFIKNNVTSFIYSIEFNCCTSSNLSKPIIRITNLANRTFNLTFIRLVEMDSTNMTAKTQKFIGEKLNSSFNFQIINEKPYANSNTLSITNLRIENLLKISCNNSCNGCSDYGNKNCTICKNNFKNYNSFGCIEINTNNCNTNSDNPSFCQTCNIGSSPVIQEISIRTNRVLCFQCHSTCGGCSSYCNNISNCSALCKECYFLENSHNKSPCKNCNPNCFECNYKCNTCRGDLEGDCYNCKDPTKWINIKYPHECISCSITGIYGNRKKLCSSCHSSCLTCFNNNNKSCWSCNTNYILYNSNKCLPLYFIDKCLPNHILRPVDPSNIYRKYERCMKCDKGCYRCNLANTKECLGCLYGYHLFNNTNCTRCDGDNVFINYNSLGSNQQPICQSCHSSCKKCSSASQNNCLVCANGKYLLVSTNSTTCVTCNQPGYFIDNLNCKLCDDNCSTCVNKSTNCLSCKNNLLLDNIKNDCVNNCRNGTYQHQHINSCFICHKTCKNCNGGTYTDCLNCNDDLYLDIITNECTNCLNLGKIKVGSNCHNCNVNCRTCNGLDKNNCLSCNNKLKLHEISHECINNCPTYTYEYILDNLYYCRGCYYGCLKCLNFKKNSCLECDTGYLYNKYNKDCLKTCEIGYYKLNNNCEKCPIKCSKCNSFDFCYECNAGFYLKNNKECVTCNNGYYISKEKCLKCINNCLNCVDYDNCTSCEANKTKTLNDLTNKFFCKWDCSKENKIFNKLENRCITCEECNNCQINNDYLCKSCSKCNYECKFNFKFNETGLFLSNSDNNFKINITNIKYENKLVFKNVNINNTYYHFDIFNNTDNLNIINLNFTTKNILELKNCTKTFNDPIVIKKIYDKNCEIEKLIYDFKKNLLSVNFNFKINKLEFPNNFSYRITETTDINFKKIILNMNLNYTSEKSASFSFIPNYYKSKYNVTILFNKNIIEELNCKLNFNISKEFIIEGKNKNYINDSIENLNILKNTLKSNNTISKALENVKPLIKNVNNSVIGTVLFSTIFSQFLSLLIRFFQVVYILDYILLLKIYWGNYTNTFIEFINLDFKLSKDIGETFNIKKNNLDNKLSNISNYNPKLKDSEFLYLTDLNIELIFGLILITLEFFSIIVKFILKNQNKDSKIKDINSEYNNTDRKSKSKKTINISTIKIRKKKIKNNKDISIQNIENKKSKKKPKQQAKIRNMEYFRLKIKSLKFTYIGAIFPNLIGSILIYSQIFYDFNNSLEDIKLMIIFIIYYILIVSYIYEISIVTIHQNLYKKQKYSYREDFFLFKTKEIGLHNYILILTILRDFILIFIAVLVNLIVILQLIIFTIIQWTYVVIIFKMKSKFDYKNIQLFKLQELINLILIILSLILYFTSFEFFQFLFIIMYIFLIFISVLNLFQEIYLVVYYYLIIIINNIKIWVKNKYNK